MMRRLILVLLPVLGVVVGAALGARLPLGGTSLAAGVAACLALAAAAALLAAPLGRLRPREDRGPVIPRSQRSASHRTEPPTVSGYWRAHDAPDWPEGEVRRERVREGDEEEALEPP